LPKTDFSTIQIGKNNLENPTIQTKNLAKKRLEICKNCPDFQTEPIPFLRITDEKIPELSEKYCKNCGCALPYKTRQNLQTCPKW